MEFLSNFSLSSATLETFLFQILIISFLYFAAKKLLHAFANQPSSDAIEEPAPEIQVFDYMESVDLFFTNQILWFLRFLLSTCTACLRGFFTFIDQWMVLEMIEPPTEGRPPNRSSEGIPPNRLFEKIHPNRSSEEITQNRFFGGIPPNRSFERMTPNRFFEGIPPNRSSEGIPPNRIFEGIPQNRSPQNRFFEGKFQNSSSEGIPPNIFSEGISTSRLFEGIPSNRMSEGISQNRLFEGIPPNSLFERTPQSSSSKGIPQNISPERIPQNISSKGIPQNISPEGIPQNISPEGTPQNISSKGIPHNISPEGIPQNISPEGTPQNTVPPEVVPVRPKVKRPNLGRGEGLSDSERRNLGWNSQAGLWVRRLRSGKIYGHVPVSHIRSPRNLTVEVSESTNRNGDGFQENNASKMISGDFRLEDDPVPVRRGKSPQVSRPKSLFPTSKVSTPLSPSKGRGPKSSVA